MGSIYNIKQQISQIIKPEFFYIVFAAVAIFISLFVVIKKLVYLRNRSFLTIRKEKRSLGNVLCRFLMRSQLLSRALKILAIKISIFNRYSFEKNLEYAAFICIITFFFTLLSIMVFLPNTTVVWYLFLSYIFMALLFVCIILVVFFFIAKQRFTSKMPDTFKLINSRYIITGNILKAINISMDDFDKTVKREMFKVYDVLKKNNIYEINLTFKVMERTYKNEYFTLLLNLIKQAYYRGGNEVIKKQFEDTTEEILLDIENQKDLSFTSRTYIFIALFLPFGVKFLESFNANALGDKAREFYVSPGGIEIKIFFYFVFLLYLGFMLFLERTA